jgi:DNA (cytosine-5)-methyltransferase 1
MDVLSLFCGCGGLDLGFEQAGHRVIWANDVDKYACQTYAENFPTEPLKKDIRKVKNFPDADIVIGGYPCQGFSLAGSRDAFDKRNYLYLEFARVLKAVKPRFFVAENVKGVIVPFKSVKAIDRMVRKFESCGYHVTWQLLNAKRYGVPQDRERVFIVGTRDDLNLEFAFPEKTHGEPPLKPYVTLRDAIGGLPEPKEGEYYDHSGFSSRYMSRNRIRGWDEVSFTIQASGRHTPLHPNSPPMRKIGTDKWEFTDHIGKYRRLSVKECARIQAFPDDFAFCGPLNSQYMQIGNAVPPLLARNIAEALATLVPAHPKLAKWLEQ